MFHLFQNGGSIGTGRALCALPPFLMLTVVCCKMWEWFLSLDACQSQFGAVKRSHHRYGSRLFRLHSNGIQGQGRDFTVTPEQKWDIPRPVNNAALNGTINLSAWAMTGKPSELRLLLCMKHETSPLRLGIAQCTMRRKGQLADCGALSRAYFYQCNNKDQQFHFSPSTDLHVEIWCQHPSHTFAITSRTLPCEIVITLSWSANDKSPLAEVVICVWCWSL